METGIIKNHFRHGQATVDLVTMLMGILAVCLGVFVFFDIEGRIQWLSMMFLLAALVDMISGMKAFYYGRRLSGIGMCVTSVFVFAFAVVSYIVIWV